MDATYLLLRRSTAAAHALRELHETDQGEKHGPGPGDEGCVDDTSHLEQKCDTDQRDE